MTDYEKPEGTLAESEGVYRDDDGELVAQMETLQKGGGDLDSDE